MADYFSLNIPTIPTTRGSDTQLQRWEQRLSPSRLKMRKRPMARRGKSAHSDDLFVDPSGQLRLLDKSAEQHALEKSKVECLGMTFDSEDARRAHFTDRLREKLADPEFRKTPGFPKGTDEDIIRMSDPPWHTACPNPFLADFVRVYG